MTIAPDAAWTDTGGCPDCGGHWFYAGPRGGAAINLKCCDCGAKWWYGGSPLFGARRIDNDDSLYDLTAKKPLDAFSWSGAR